MSALVQLVGVSKSFADAAAVHAVDLSVERGKTTVLIGPSGCGKSTLMRLIVGLLKPDSGEIKFDGTPLGVEQIDIVRHRIGYVIQEGGLFPHLTARGNVLLMARHLQRGETETSSRLSELCALTRF
ncbi:MAG TPA: ATP-binding cassette domain-containing protein, partial [Chthoniobacterales bacterium]|nr:ATP-binding cassette domain-containing protein [Chthoniobacterales bacterium]